MAAPVILIAAPGTALIERTGGPLLVVDSNPEQPWRGKRTLNVNATGARTVRDIGGRRLTQITARVGEQVDTTVRLYESDVALTDDLTAAACEWVATRSDRETIRGDATGATSGTVTLHLDIPAGTTDGWWELWVQVDGVTWPTERKADALPLKIEKDV